MSSGRILPANPLCTTMFLPTKFACSTNFICIWSHLWFSGARECPQWYSIVGATVTVHQFFYILHFCHTCSLCRVEMVVQFPARGSTQALLCLFPGVFWLWHFLYSVGPHPVSSLHIYTFVVSRTFMAGAASQAGDADSSRAPGLTSGFHGPVNVHSDTLLLVRQWQCISSFLFYTKDSKIEWLNCGESTRIYWVETMVSSLDVFKFKVIWTAKVQHERRYNGSFLNWNRYLLLERYGY